MSEPTDPDELARFADLARRRRTNLRIDVDRPVPEPLLHTLCELAQWAPNHHRTWPWRFAALLGPARAALGACLAEDLRCRSASPEQIRKAETKYERAPVMLAVAVGHQPGDDAERRAEDRDAVAAGIQNILLGATAAGLASYWGTGRVLELPTVRQLCGFAEDDRLVALLYLGYPLGNVAIPSRPEPNLRIVT